MEDVERLFGEGAIRFIEQHKYKNEAKYLRTIRNWRRAVDGKVNIRYSASAILLERFGLHPQRSNSLVLSGKKGPQYT